MQLPDPLESLKGFGLSDQALESISVATLDRHFLVHRSLGGAITATEPSEYLAHGWEDVTESEFDTFVASQLSSLAMQRASASLAGGADPEVVETMMRGSVELLPLGPLDRLALFAGVSPAELADVIRAIVMTPPVIT